MNNAAFAALHATVLGFGIRYALTWRAEGEGPRDEPAPAKGEVRDVELAGEPA